MIEMKIQQDLQAIFFKTSKIQYHLQATIFTIQHLNRTFKYDSRNIENFNTTCEQYFETMHPSCRKWLTAHFGVVSVVPIAPRRYHPQSNACNHGPRPLGRRPQVVPPRSWVTADFFPDGEPSRLGYCRFTLNDSRIEVP